MTLEEARTRIEEINATLATGISRVSTASGTRENDLPALAAERDRLQSAVNHAANRNRIRRGRFVE